MARAVGTGQIHDAAIFYNGSYFVIALLFNLLLLACVKRGLVDRNYTTVRGIIKQYGMGPVMYLFCFALTWWSVPLSLVMNAGMALFFLLSPDRCAKASTHRP